MPIRFTPRIANNGLDTGPAPDWQMVPLAGSRTLTLAGVGALVPVPKDASIVKAVQTSSGAGHQLVLTGLKAGKTLIDWVTAPSNTGTGAVAGAIIGGVLGGLGGAAAGHRIGRNAAAGAAPAGPVAGFQLEVSVKAERKINTAFHYVDDGRVQKTSRAIADLAALVAGANAILDRQANVKIVKKSAAALPIAQNLRKVVRFSSHLPGVAASQHEWDDVTAHADAAADFNVFFVKKYEQDDTPLENNTRAGTIAAEKNCLLEDNIANAAETLAHETIHLLGIGPHSPTRGHLIASGAVRNGQFISKAQANQINPSGA